MNEDSFCDTDENLDEKRRASLKDSWIGLLNSIGEQHSLLIEEIIDSTFVDEIFFAITNDNPDVNLLGWLRANK
ncbi:unnamed protein product [Rotaria magnacalcarata]|uniref:Uncharacterized protein n=1 Tax=Rotaria magnacalcarata TaxID=392030 RepID=A0A816RCP6_9BILA|nr:unnamed protein product [Rotaria magnacalcarata]CAF1618398.1 unnamed protein product [Rotaria magnacalcarata]CAF1983079.1 unnamed protein product [Rotaria magnacalcarata]CAF2072232.1 unnamed protein product [Rotaria magnacalcarata]CAF2106445.1 unnamed protein product [Rotaria magnacalcarata]